MKPAPPATTTVLRSRTVILLSCAYDPRRTLAPERGSSRSFNPDQGSSRGAQSADAGASSGPHATFPDLRRLRQLVRESRERAALSAAMLTDQTFNNPS